MTVLRSSHSDGCRAQTEPIAALIAVAVMGMAISLYAGYHTDALASSGIDRDVSQPTIERVWTEMEHMGAYNRNQPLEAVIDHRVLPEGKTVYIRITFVGDTGAIEELRSVTFLPSGSTEPYRPGPPAGVNNESRPIPVRYSSGDVRGARLHVGTYDGT